MENMGVINMTGGLTLRHLVIWELQASVSVDFLLVNCSFECIIALTKGKDKRTIINRVI